MLLFFYVFLYKKNIKNRHVNNYKHGLFSENDRLHELQCKLKEKRVVQAVENNINK